MSAFSTYTANTVNQINQSAKATEVVGHLMAVAASGLLLLLAKCTLDQCLGTFDGCGTPCATLSFELFIAPLLLTLPFAKLLTASALSVSGLIARCAVTSSIGVWLVAVLLAHYRYLLL